MYAYICIYILEITTFVCNKSFERYMTKNYKCILYTVLNINNSVARRK